MPFSQNPMLAPVTELAAGDPLDHRVPVVSLVRSGRPVSEGIRLHHNRDHVGYILQPEVEGLGVAPSELQSAALAGGGSVFRHSRLTEGDVFLPITLAAKSPSQLPDMFDRLVQLVQPGRGVTYDVVVYDPYGQETRTRSLVFESGLSDPVRVTPRLWRTSITGRFMDPYWYGVVRELNLELGALEKKFITAYEGDPDTGEGAYEFPFFPVLVGGSTIQGEFDLKIAGNAPVWWSAGVHGPGEDFLMRNQDGDELFIEGQISDPILIQTKPQDRDITLADGTPVWDRLKDPKRRKMFPLEPGENRVLISMVGAGPQSKVKIRYREAFYHAIGGGGQ